MTYEVTIPQLPALQRAFTQAPETVAREVATAGNRALIRYQATAKQNAPVDRGQLRSSLLIKPMTKQGNEIQGSMGTGIKHAIWMEEGTGIYGPANSPIRPKRAKSLMFTVGGQRVFARSVKGAKPHWYMRTSVRQNQSATQRDFATALDNMANTLGGSV